MFSKLDVLVSIQIDRRDKRACTHHYRPVAKWLTELNGPAFVFYSIRPSLWKKCTSARGSLEALSAIWIYAKMPKCPIENESVCLPYSGHKCCSNNSIQIITATLRDSITSVNAAFRSICQCIEQCAPLICVQPKTREQFNKIADHAFEARPLFE